MEREASSATQDAASNHSLATRRHALTFLATTTVSLSSSPHEAAAYERTYPRELQAQDAILDNRQIQRKFLQQQQQPADSLFIPKQLMRPTGALLWGAALWLLSGSRSNPLVTPVANVLYSSRKDDNKEEEGWLKDRNDGLFADLPLPLLGALLILFLLFGLGTDSLLTYLAQGNHTSSLQLAGVTLISAAALELGRIASGEKLPTRIESDRSLQLQGEFVDFASKRLKMGGNCHRTEVVAAFRRYYTKYRRADNPAYPLADLEIEQLLKQWSRRQTTLRVEMTSAGFYYGIQINKDADVFV
jgi:hypothetical protein